MKRTKLQERPHVGDSRVLYLRNLSYECTPQEIASLFAQWQPVKVTKRTEKKTPKRRGKSLALHFSLLLLLGVFFFFFFFFFFC